MADEASQLPSDPVFQGFDMPRQNWFKMPNSWTDITADISSLAELKVIEYVLKHTWGYREYGLTKRITTDEFMHGRRRKDGTRMDRGTGLSKPSVVAGLKSAVAHGYLEEITNDTDLARIKKYYSLKMLPGTTPNDEPLTEENLPITPEESLEIPGVKNLNSDVKNLNIGGNLLNIGGKESLHRSERDTLERHQQTDTENNNNRNTPPNDRVVVALLDQGISRPVARKLARIFPAEYIILKLEYLEFLVAKRPHEVKKPAAWLRKAIEDDYTAPDGFISSEDRQRQADVEKSRNQAILEAQERQRKLRDADEKARAAKMEKKRKRLHAQYGTRPDDIAFWETALKDLSFTTGGVHALVATAEILKVTEDRVILGIPHQFQFQQLQHPGYQAALKRLFKQLSRRPLGLELILIADDVIDHISRKASNVDE